MIQVSNSRPQANYLLLPVRICIVKLNHLFMLGQLGGIAAVGSTLITLLTTNIRFISGLAIGLVLQPILVRTVPRLLSTAAQARADQVTDREDWLRKIEDRAKTARTTISRGVELHEDKVDEGTNNAVRKVTECGPPSTVDESGIETVRELQTLVQQALESAPMSDNPGTVQLELNALLTKLEDEASDARGVSSRKERLAAMWQGRDLGGDDNP